MDSIWNTIARIYKDTNSNQMSDSENSCSMENSCGRVSTEDNHSPTTMQSSYRQNNNESCGSTSSKDMGIFTTKITELHCSAEQNNHRHWSHHPLHWRNHSSKRPYRQQHQQRDCKSSIQTNIMQLARSMHEIPPHQEQNHHHYNHHQHHHHHHLSQHHQLQHHHSYNSPNKSQTLLKFHHRTILSVFILLLLGLLVTPTMASYDVCKDVENDLLLPCHPSIFDAANSQSLKLTLDPSDTTCGTPASNFQRLGDRANTVYTCDAASTTGNAHPLSNIVDADSVTWWQSIGQTPGTTDLNINVTMSFNKLYRFAGDVILTFNSGRPEKMIIEKSVDNGATWTPLQFYARNCADYADQVDIDATFSKENPTVVVCTNRYVELKSQPRPGGRVTFDLNERFELFLGPTLTDYASYYEGLDTLMLDFLVFSDLRFRFIRPASDGRGNFDEYYYAIQDVNVMARCYCNLHASNCNNNENGLVCDCQHNTQGVNCEECLPLYNEQPWKRGNYMPYNTGKANQCEKCECNEHADSCTYDPSYNRGVCNNCTHNTKGKHCETCLESFYPNTTTAISDPQRCLACDCNTLGTTEGTVCAQSAAPPKPIGQCVCKEQVTGRQCDSCVPGFYGLLEEPNIGNCTACECDLDGTQGQSNSCAQSGGQCPCKSSITGRQCDTCKNGYFGFPRGKPQEDCKPCECNEGGSTSLTCDKATGKCPCKSGMDGDKCDRSASGSYVPPIDSLGIEPVSGDCQVTSDIFTDGAPFDGKGFAQCDLSTSAISVTFDSMAGGMIQAALQWPYYPTIRYTNKNAQSVTGKITVTLQGDTTQPLSPLAERLGSGITPGCPGGSPIERDITLPFGSSTAFVLTDNPIVMDGRCKFGVTLTLNPVSSNVDRRKRQANGNALPVQIDSVSFLPALTTTDQSTALAVYTSAEDKAVVVQSYQNCLQQVAVLTTRNSAMARPPCDDLLLAVVADIYNGATECACNTDGSLFPTQCASLGGQCTCKSGVGGRACDTCQQGFFNFTSEGCQACQCYPKGSQHGACDLTTGQCPCLSNILTQAAVTNVRENEIGRTCSRCLPNFYGIDTGSGCTACSCNSQGSTSLQCDDNGQCPCKDSILGLKCGQCKPGFYGFGDEGCSACNCSNAGSTSINCDQASGVCTCKENVQGDKCDECKSQMFNLATHNPKGCQPCFCFGHGQGCQSASGFESDSIRVTGSSPLNLDPVLGMRHTSYGTELSLGVTADFSLNIEEEKLLTFEGNDLMMHHMARPGTTIPRDATLAYKVRLLEGEWKKDVNGTPTDITAQELMGILSDLSKVFHLTRSKGQNVKLTYFQMEIPKERGVESTNQEIAYVEQCTCDPAANVAGLSCGDCATGFRRPNDANTSTSFDSCVACNCNSRGATNPPECDPLTGMCLNCRNGTMGDQCESCANNVIGAECDTCVDGFYGLREDGCRPCECNSPGSTSTICDKSDGQCSCAPNVGGRTCDKCEENFYRLTADGCIECDACYSLLKGGVADLRAIRDLLVANVSLIDERNSNNPSTKPFTVRFQETVDDTNKLILFLESAEASENEVQTQIVSLDQSLQIMEGELTTIDNVTMPEVERNLVSGESAIAKAQQYRASLEASATDANSKLDSLETRSQTLSDLASDIKQVKDILQALADASTADTEILNELNTLNETVHKSNKLANEILAKSQAALEVQKNTTGQLLSLESHLIVLGNKADKTSTSTASLGEQSQETSNAVVKLQRNLAELTAFNVDFDALKTRTDTASAVTDARQNQMTADQASFQETKTKAEATVDVVNDLTNQSNIIGNKAADWISRSQKAEEQAQLISQRAKSIFDETEATLKLLQDFDNRAKEVESQANAKLEQVASVQTVSKQLIEDSQTLTDSLSSLQQMAANAKETSEQSKQVIQTKLTQIEGVERKANELKTQLDSMDSGGKTRLDRIEAAKTNVIKPGDILCSNINDNQISFNTELVITDTVTTDTLETVGNTTEKANAILTQLRGLEKVDANAAEGLYTQITTARSSLKVDELTATINNLLQAKDTQRAEIDRLKAQKDSIRQQVDSLKTLLQQIRPASPN